MYFLRNGLEGLIQGLALPSQCGLISLCQAGGGFCAIQLLSSRSFTQNETGYFGLEVRPYYWTHGDTSIHSASEDTVGRLEQGSKLKPFHTFVLWPWTPEFPHSSLIVQQRNP